MKIFVRVDGRLEGKERTLTEYFVSVPFRAYGQNSLEFLNQLLGPGLDGKRYVEVFQFELSGVFFPQGAKTVEIEAKPVLLSSGEQNLLDYQTGKKKSDITPSRQHETYKENYNWPFGVEEKHA